MSDENDDRLQTKLREMSGQVEAELLRRGWQVERDQCEFELGKGDWMFLKAEITREDLDSSVNDVANEIESELERQLERIDDEERREEVITEEVREGTRMHPDLADMIREKAVERRSQHLHEQARERDSGNEPDTAAGVE